MSKNDETTWASTREKYTRIFEAPPGFTDENDIAATFRNHPHDVITELDRIAQGFANGRLHSPWRVMARKLDKIAGDHDHIDINSGLRIRQAEAWIRNAGVHCATEAEIRSELFHATSALLAGLEAELGNQMITLWKAERARGEYAEQEFLERAERIRRSRVGEPVGGVRA